MRNMKLILIIISALAIQNCDKVEQTDKTPIEINIGNDTTILFGDTLVLDAGLDFDSYSWNDGLSIEQKLSVTEAGKYWVEVTKKDRYGTDSIIVDTIHKSQSEVTADTCEGVNEVSFFETYFLKYPCTYIVTSGTGEDTDFFSSWLLDNENHKIVKIGYERDVMFKNDTINTIPYIYKEKYSNQIIIRNESETEIGVLFFENIDTKYIDVEGVFLSKEEENYFEILTVSYQQSKESEVHNILSTLNIIK